MRTKGETDNELFCFSARSRSRRTACLAVHMDGGAAAERTVAMGEKQDIVAPSSHVFSNSQQEVFVAALSRNALAVAHRCLSVSAREGLNTSSDAVQTHAGRRTGQTCLISPAPWAPMGRKARSENQASQGAESRASRLALQDAQSLCLSLSLRRMVSCHAPRTGIHEEPPVSLISGKGLQ